MIPYTTYTLKWIYLNLNLSAPNSEEILTSKFHEDTNSNAWSVRLISTSLVIFFIFNRDHSRTVKRLWGNFHKVRCIFATYTLITKFIHRRTVKQTLGQTGGVSYRYAITLKTVRWVSNNFDKSCLQAEQQTFCES